MQLLIGIFLLSLCVTIALGYPLLQRLRLLFSGVDTIREDVPERHLSKGGTPAMGGVIFLVPSLILCFFLWQLLRQSPDVPVGVRAGFGLIILVTMACALLGFIDDRQKYLRKRGQAAASKRGISGKMRLAIEGLCGAVAALVAMYTGTIDTIVPLGFASGVAVDLGWGFPFFAALVVMATTNAVNLTDGLDGLASGVSIIVLLALVALGTSVALAGTAGGFAQFVSQVGLVLPALVVAGCLAGFLWFNAYPAKVFMGDTGSLAIGGMVAMTALLTDTAVWLLLLGIVYVAETLSVMIQVFCFQRWGFRVFRMTPIHHHFEQKGMAETHIVLRMWLITLVAAGIVLLIEL